MKVTDQMTRFDVHTYILRKNRQHTNRNDSRVQRGSTGTYRSILRDPGAVRSLKRSERRSKRVTASLQNCDKKERGTQTPSQHQMTSGEGRESGDDRVAEVVTGSERGRNGARRRGGGECERAVVEQASERARSQAAMAMAGVKEQEGAFRVLLETLSSSAPG